jgi:bacillolysin
MKKLYLFLLLPFTIFAQDGFQQKTKPKSNGPTKEKTLQLTNGQQTESELGVIERPLADFNYNKNKVIKDDKGNVVFVEIPSKPNLEKNAKKGLLIESYEFLSQIKDVLKIQNPAKEFELVEQHSDEQGNNHLKFRQLYKGIPVYGSEVILHEVENQIKTMNGRSFQSPVLENINPSIDGLSAKKIALEDLKTKSIIQQDVFSKSIIKSQEQSPELMVFHDKNKAEFLAWQLVVKPNLLERWVYFIDAVSGKILDKYNNTCSLDGTIKATAADLNGISKTFSVYQAGSQYVMIDTDRPMFKRTASVLPDEPVGAIWTIDAGNTAGENFSQISSASQNVWNAKAVSAHTNAGLAYEFYRTKFNRNSLNNKGGNIVSVINISDEKGQGMDNAYWNGEFMGYGNGKTAFKPLAGSLDVAGHEMTHGVVENSAKLEYRNQSGAINESMADVFGVMIENANLPAGQAINWTLGESVVKTSAFPSGALRSLSNPNQGGTRDPGYQPKTMGQYAFLNDTEEEDNGGVHINSGIPNYAFYLFASNPKIGLDNAAKVYYKALTSYLTRQSQFLDLRLAVVQSAKELNPEFEAIAKAAFDQVGIKDGSSGEPSTTPTTPTQPKAEVPVNAGTEYLVVYDPVLKELYISPSSADNFVVISTKGLKSKPSITDDGSAIYYVGNDKNIYAIANPTSTNRKESKLTSSGEFDNVAVSKDGKRLAALREVEDHTMYVYDLTSANIVAKPFNLYNPTYSTGVQTGEVKYADSFEWDYTGESIVYDAFNTVKNSTGGKEIDYWDVGLIKVWDVAKNTFAGGTIQKIFSNLEEGDNIGNPSFSKTSPDILAFDFFNSKSTDKVFKVLGVDLYKNTFVEIATNNDVGYPNYTKDDKKITFNTLAGKRQDIAVVNLKADKITPLTTKNTIYTDASWGVWFAFGQRKLPTKVAQSITVKAIADQKKAAKVVLTATASSKLPVQFTIVSGDASIDGSNLTCGNTAGKVVVQAFQIGNGEFNAATPVQISFNILSDGGSVKQNQTIGAFTIADQKKAAKIALAATASSNLAIVYSIVSGDASISGTTLTCGNTVGKVTVRASQDGNADFNAATPVETSFNIINDAIVKQSQSITAADIPNQYPGSTLILNYSASSKLDVAISVLAGDASVKDGVLTCGTRLGVVTLRFAQAGNTDFNAAISVDKSFNIIARPAVLSIQPNDVELLFYPNPTADVVMIKEVNGLKINQLTLVSSSGKVIKTIENNEAISLKNLPSGQYILKAETNKGIIVKKIVRE